MHRKFGRRQKEIMRLVAEVCLAGHSASAWTERLAQGIADLFDARMVGMAWATLPDRPGAFNRAEVELHWGLTDDEVRQWNDTYWHPGNEFRSEFLRRVVNIPARFVTVRRQDVMSDEEWYEQPDVRTLHRALNIDANMASFFVTLTFRRLFGIGVHRAWGKPQFSHAERRELRMLHVELARVWSNHLAHPTLSNRIDRLPPRLREVLWLLCLGLSEKEIATRLKLSVHTVHNHVKRLYKFFEVTSRAELLARTLSHGRIEPVAMPGSADNQFKR